MMMIFFNIYKNLNISRRCDTYIKTFILIDIIGFFNRLEN